MEKYVFAIEMLDKALKLNSLSALAYYYKGLINILMIGLCQ